MVNCYLKNRRTYWFMFLIFLNRNVESTGFIESTSYHVASTTDLELSLSDHDQVVEVLVRTCRTSKAATEDLPFLVGIGAKKKKPKLKNIDLGLAGEYQIVSVLNTTHHYLENYFLVVYDSKGPTFTPSRLVTDKTYDVIVALTYALKDQYEAMVIPTVTYTWSLGGIGLTARNVGGTLGCPLVGKSIVRLKTQRYLGGQNLTCRVELTYGSNKLRWTVGGTIYAPVMITSIVTPSRQLMDSIQITCLIDSHQFPAPVDYLWFIKVDRVIVLGSKTPSIVISRDDIPFTTLDYIVVGCNATNGVATSSKTVVIDIKSYNSPNSTDSEKLRYVASKVHHYLWLFMGLGFAFVGFLFVQTIFCISRSRLRSTVGCGDNVDWGRCSAWRLQGNGQPPAIESY